MTGKVVCPGPLPTRGCTLRTVRGAVAERLAGL